MLLIFVFFFYLSSIVCLSVYEIFNFFVFRVFFMPYICFCMKMESEQQGSMQKCVLCPCIFPRYFF